MYFSRVSRSVGNLVDPEMLEFDSLDYEKG